jgi:hypothetical protein
MEPQQQQTGAHKNRQKWGCGLANKQRAAQLIPPINKMYNAMNEINSK